MPIDHRGQYIREEGASVPSDEPPTGSPVRDTSSTGGAKYAAWAIGLFLILWLGSQVTKKQPTNVSTTSQEHSQALLQTPPPAQETATAPAVLEENFTDTAEETSQEQTTHSTQEIEDVEAKVNEFLSAWERKDIRTAEFLLKNDFQGEGGISKWKWLDLRKAEASRTQSRQITASDMQTSVDANVATVTFTQTYADEFYDGKKYSSVLKTHIELIKWSDQQWYLFKLRYSQP